MYYVYVLIGNKNDQMYIGSTSNLERRLREHNNGHEISTKKYMPWKLQYYEAYKTEELARVREKNLKQHGNAKRELKKRIGLAINKSGVGFTLLEVLVVMTIVFVLFGIGLPLYNSVRENIALKNYSYEIVNALRLAQNRAITSQDGTNHGVYFYNKDYVLFGNQWSSPTYTKPYHINNGIQITNGVGSEIIFNRLDGTTNDQLIVITASNGNQRTIKIESTGSISIL
ncbi:MAG: hypothetical protein A3J62_03580 [Candidatus Buchananbacteria bacterium RIFCSPHIGHO2_02_FULL_38_8]|uniref:GIY-YIG domain-containing protein n=2 Tax=Candidatus Buchananiibacteriota TaxID=1817903 RepID=A0A1G1Y1F8_9BACT|nr:MAG: hypothetical protein A2731_03240 [Candidatus Buchananbacteria bacterium RIFCSPHIGHO2_01_FULL_39_8]OGY47242.1 MAG: hypothetical protein A3J62_03580 [Candidatus Buchananbacteria bacterium RIFCSPHIGHO2_02_FULL_38_8]